MMRVAIAGAGSIVPDFLEAASQIPQFELYAIFGRETSLPRMTEFQNQYRISRIYQDYEEMLADENVDVVYIALPNHLHYAFAKKAVENRKHVIVEKPFASTCEQAKDLVDAARANRVMLFEAISNQYMPNYQKTRELLAQIGNVRIVQLNYSQYSRRYDLFKAGTIHPVFDPKKSGGALMDLNIYNIHYVLGLFGKPDRIHYIANIERGIDTSGILTMEYPDFQCVCIGAKDCKAPVSINIQGDQGFIHSDEPANVYGSFCFAQNNGEAEQFACNGGRPRLYHELKVFADMVSTNDQESCDRYIRHTLDVQAILDEARYQAGVYREIFTT